MHERSNSVHHISFSFRLFVTYIFSNYLETVLLDEFLTNLVMKEYVWQLNRQDIKWYLRT